MIELRNYPPHWTQEQRQALRDVLEASFALFLIDHARGAAGTGGNPRETALRDEYRNYVRDTILPRWRGAHGS